MIPPRSSLFLWIALAGLALPAHGQADDPERTSEGRTSYLGRSIARTMHWTGADWLLRETREREENGDLLHGWLRIREGQTVCDFGCGNGYHTLPLARAVGAKGLVYAVDVQLPMLAMLRERLGEAGVDNVKLIEASIDDPKVPPASCDLVLMVDVYHELTHPVSVLARVRRALKPSGRLVVVEFRAEDEDVPIQRVHRMSKAQIVREMAAGGFRWTRGYDGLPWQHAMTFTVADPIAEEQEVAHAFWRAVRAGDAPAAGGFLAPRVSTDPSRFKKSADVMVPGTLQSDIWQTVSG